MPDMSNTDNWSDAQNRAMACRQTGDALDFIENCARAIGTAIGSTHGRWQGLPSDDEMAALIEGWLESYAYADAKRYGLDGDEASDLADNRWPLAARRTKRWGFGVYGMAAYVAAEAATEAYLARFPEKREGGAS